MNGPPPKSSARGGAGRHAPIRNQGGNQFVAWPASMRHFTDMHPPPLNLVRTISPRVDETLANSLIHAFQRSFTSLGDAGSHGFLPLPSSCAPCTFGSTPAFMMAQKIRKKCQLNGVLISLKIKGFMYYMPQNSERLAFRHSRSEFLGFLTGFWSHCQPRQPKHRFVGGEAVAQPGDLAARSASTRLPKVA